mgnify:CR=1 FL=1
MTIDTYVYRCRKCNHKLGNTPPPEGWVCHVLDEEVICDSTEYFKSYEPISDCYDSTYLQFWKTFTVPREEAYQNMLGKAKD